MHYIISGACLLLCGSIADDSSLFADRQQAAIENRTQFQLVSSTGGLAVNADETCASTADTTTFIKGCDDCASRGWHIRLVCAGCRHKSHWNTRTGFLGAPTRHSQWMITMSSSKGRVCAKCNREQDLSHSQGFDDCTCFQDRYSSVWTCNNDNIRRCSRSYSSKPLFKDTYSR